jgi:hypothetical protein
MDDDLLDPTLMEDAEEIGDEEELDADGLPIPKKIKDADEEDEEEDEM